MLCKHGRSYSEARAFRYIKRFCDDDMRWFRIMFTFFSPLSPHLALTVLPFPCFRRAPIMIFDPRLWTGGTIGGRHSFFSLPCPLRKPHQPRVRLGCIAAQRLETRWRGVAAHARASTRQRSSFPAHEALLALVSAGGTGRRANQTEPKKLRRPGFSLKEGAR